MKKWIFLKVWIFSRFFLPRNALFIHLHLKIFPRLRLTYITTRNQFGIPPCCRSLPAHTYTVDLPARPLSLTEIRDAVIETIEA